jgi:hypothetical protein
MMMRFAVFIPCSIAFKDIFSLLTLCILEAHLTIFARFNRLKHPLRCCFYIASYSVVKRVSVSMKNRLVMLKKWVGLLFLGVSLLMTPMLASACTSFPSPWACYPGPWNSWRHHHDWHHHKNNGAILGLLAVGAVAGVIIGAAASQSAKRPHCWIEVHHHRRYRVCSR